jgi:hypothetical protein
MALQQPDPQTDIIQILVDELVTLRKRVEALESNEYPTGKIKSDTGDPATGYSFQFVNNTFDNNLKVWLEGAWRTVLNY